MTRETLGWLAAAVSLAAVLMAGPGLADDKELAKEHFLRGKALVEEGAYEKAIVELEASYGLNPAPIVLYNMGVCFDQLHQYADALKYYNLYLTEEKSLPEEMKEDVANRIEKLGKFIGLLELEADVAGAEILIDDKLVGMTPAGEIFIETGNHDLVVRKPGYGEYKKKVKIVSGETTKISVALQKSEETGDAPLPAEKVPVEPSVDDGEQMPEKKKGRKLGPAAFAAAVGLTGAFAVSAAVVGALAVKKNNEVGDMYEDQGWQDVMDERDRLALATDVLIGLAAGAAVASIVLIFFTDFKKEKRAKGGALLLPDPGNGSLTMGYQGVF